MSFNVLVACEESQRVCSAFRERGCDAFSCDLFECSGGHPEWHVMGDVLPLVGGNCVFTTMDGERHSVDGKWDLIVAFPPCTYLSNAGACRLYPKKGQMDMERYRKGLEGKEFFMKFYEADCPHVAVENPVSSSVFKMPPHSQEVQPYQFNDSGEHPYTKKTRLWLRGLPNLVATTPDCVPTGPYIPSGTGRRDRTKYGFSKHGSRNRSKTFPGIADAMAEQWTRFLETETT